MDGCGLWGEGRSGRGALPMPWSILAWAGESTLLQQSLCPAAEGSWLLGLAVPAPPPAPRKEPRSGTAGRPRPHIVRQAPGSFNYNQFATLSKSCFPPPTPARWTQAFQPSPGLKSFPSRRAPSLLQGARLVGLYPRVLLHLPGLWALPPGSTPSWRVLFGDRVYEVGPKKAKVCGTGREVTHYACNLGQMTRLCQGNQGFPTRETWGLGLKQAALLPQLPDSSQVALPSERLCSVIKQVQPATHGAPEIPTAGRLRKEGWEFKPILCYIASPCWKTNREPYLA